MLRVIAAEGGNRVSEEPLSFLGWLTLTGVLLLLMGLASAHLRRIPVSTSGIYLALGVIIGPLGFGWLSLDVREAAWFERVTEIAVVISLFSSGLKLRLPLRHPAWGAAYRLAGPVMLTCIVGVALIGIYGLGMGVAEGLLLGALLAPTDPVLASSVSVNEAADEDRVRYGLSGEAGLNDGMAFPFVVFALSWSEQHGAGPWIGGWLVTRVLWAIPAALLLGFALGKGIGRLSIRLRSQHRDSAAPSDLLALALIALSYVGAERIGAWGFLAVFAAGLGLRRAETTVVQATPHPDVEAELPAAQDQSVAHPPAEDLILAKTRHEALQQPAIAAGVLVSEAISFGDTAERLVEVGLVVLVGAAVVDYWDMRALPLAFALFCIIRPLSTHLFAVGTVTTHAQRWLMGWFGIRGIGSLYYLSYALRHGLAGSAAREVCDLTLSVVALSIVVHGISAQPLLSRYEQTLSTAERT